MRKINTLFNEHSELKALTKNVQMRQHLQLLWQTAAPKLLSESSFVSSLTNGQLTVYANSSIVASKIKLTQASLLTQLQNLQQTQQSFRECKVTAISVKVQVKSRHKAVIKTPRKLSASAVNSLKNLAGTLGESSLASKLKNLATKT